MSSVENVNKELSQYFQRLKRLLDCPKPLRNSFLAQTRRMAEDFIVGRPDTTQEDLISYLGEPEELARGFLETLDPEIMAQHKKRRSLLLYGGIATLTVALVCVIAGFIYYYSITPVIEMTDTLIIYSPNTEVS